MYYCQIAYHYLFLQAIFFLFSITTSHIILQHRSNYKHLNPIMEPRDSKELFIKKIDSDDFNSPNISAFAQLKQKEELKRKSSLPHNLKQFIEELDQNHDSEDEGIEDYKLGGYHPVFIGEALLGRYVVIQKLGWGHFSTVWLCRDFRFGTYVAVKIQKSSPQYMDAAFDEVEILQKLAKNYADPRWNGKNRDDTKCVSLLNSFVHRTFYGNHFCMVFEILRCNLFDVLKRYNYEGLPLKICQEICKQILTGLDYMHRICDTIHTDLKPENVMLCLSTQEIKDIVENGQITKNQLFAERTEIFQRLMGVSPKHDGIKPPVEDKIKEDKQAEEEENETTTPNMQGLTKAQKKNLRKRLKKQKEKTEKQKQKTTVPTQLATQSKKEITPHPTVTQLFDMQKGKIVFNRGEKLKLPVNVKIADLGNACWKHHHFSSQIQTRQYRSPQVILGQHYNQTADIWSFGCMMYEMLTGDLLFQPKKDVNWSKNDCHLVQMQELVGRFNPDFSLRGKKSSKYFNKDGSMKRIEYLQRWPLDMMLTIKHQIKPEIAKEFADFLAPMFIPEPENRISAQEALKHPWLTKQLPDDYKMPEQEYFDLRQKFQLESQSADYNLQPLLRVRDSEPEGEDTELIEDPVEGDPDVKFVDVKLIDKSFTDLGYIGYCDGIELHTLDSKNWQFVK